MGAKQSREPFTGVLPSSSAPPNTPVPVLPQQQQPPNAPPGTPKAMDSLPPMGSPPSHSIHPSALKAVQTTEDLDEDRFRVPESVRKARTLDEFADVCSEILPGLLFVSNARVARDHAQLAAVGITHVVDCCPELALCEPQASNHSVDPSEPSWSGTVLKLILRDDVKEELRPFLDLVIETIETCRVQQGKVLIHCHQGVSRSCALAAAYVMLVQQLSAQEAMHWVSCRRRIASPNSAFICQLVEWEQELAASSDGSCKLFRLAPHAEYDAQTFVLKPCYEHATTRQQAIIGDATQNPLLWSRGLFVFAQTPERIMIWHGVHCKIANGVELAQDLVKRRLRVQQLVTQGEWMSDADTAGACGSLISTVYQTEDASEHALDHFGYANELASCSAAQASTKLRCLSKDEDVQPSKEDPFKPKLFALDLEGDGYDCWEQLVEYDSQDLLSDQACLLMDQQNQYLWVGAECSLPVAELHARAMAKLHELEIDTSHSIHMEYQDQESDAFWGTFERGY